MTAVDTTFPTQKLAGRAAFQSRRLLVLITLSAGCFWALSWAGPIFGDDKVGVQDLKSLQGTWIVVEAERDGQALDRIKGNKLIVKENHFTVVTKTAELKGDLTLDATKAPKKMDMQHQEGLLRNKLWEGIYKLDGDRFTLCYAEADSGKDRPEGFTTQDGTCRLLIVLERKQP